MMPLRAPRGREAEPLHALAQEVHEYTLAVRLRPRRSVRLPTSNLSDPDRQAADAQLRRTPRHGIGEVLLGVETGCYASGFEPDIACGPRHVNLLTATAPTIPQ